MSNDGIVFSPSLVPSQFYLTEDELTAKTPTPPRRSRNNPAADGRRQVQNKNIEPQINTDEIKGKMKKSNPPIDADVRATPPTFGGIERSLTPWRGF